MVRLRSDVMGLVPKDKCEEVKDGIRSQRAEQNFILHLDSVPSSVLILPQAPPLAVTRTSFCC